MKKDLLDVCDYLKKLVIPHTPDDFIIAEPFKHGLANDELFQGIASFRTFLYELFDKIATDKNTFDIPKGKVFDIESGNYSIRDCFPIFNDIAVVLFSLGIYGTLKTEPRNELIVCGNDLFTPFISGKPSAMKKINRKRQRELFNYLSDMGFYFEDLNIDNEIDFSKTGTFYVTCENDDNTILGLKLISEALGNVKAGFLKLASIFMRCDFYPLANETPKDHAATAGEYANPQQPKIKDWIINTEKQLIKSGCKISCFSLSNTNGDGSFTYNSRKGKKICSFGMSICGCNIAIQADNLMDEVNILPELPEDMLTFIKKRVEKGVCKEGKHKCKYKDHLQFTLNGETHTMCRWGGLNFVLNDESDCGLFSKWINLELSRV